MKPLDERKTHRKEQRELLSHGGVIPRIGKDEKESGNGTGNPDFNKMNAEHLRGWIKSKGQEVPSNITDLAKIREYVSNFAKYIAENPNGQWNS